MGAASRGGKVTGGASARSGAERTWFHPSFLMHFSAHS